MKEENKKLNSKSNAKKKPASNAKKKTVSNSNKKRTIKKPKKPSKIIRYNAKKAISYFLAAGAMLGVGATIKRSVDMNNLVPAKVISDCYLKNEKIGIEYLIREGDVIICRNAIGQNKKDKEIEAIAIDDIGNEVIGLVDKENIIEIDEISVKKLQENNAIYELSKEANLYFNSSEDSNKIEGNYSESIVIAKNRIEEKDIKNGRVKVLYLGTKDSKDELVFKEAYANKKDLHLIGDFAENYELKDFNKGNITITAEVMKDTNFRSHAKLDPNNIIERIKKGTKVEILEENELKDEYIWQHIKVGEKEGWMIRNSLAKYEYGSNKEIEEYKNEINTNKNHNNKEAKIKYNKNKVVGIDVSYMKPETLRKMLDKGTIDPRTERYNSQTKENEFVNTKEYAGKINFVYVKIAATSWGEGPIKIIENKNAKELLKICEEYKTKGKISGYGGYIYSTEITKAEVDKTAKYISDFLKDFSKEIGKDKINMLPLMIDVEYSSKGKDRQLDNAGKGRNLTEILLYRDKKYKEIMKQRTKNGGTCTYLSGRLIANTGERAINLKEINKRAPGEIDIILPNFMEKSGNPSRKTISNRNILGNNRIGDQVLMDGIYNKEKFDVLAVEKAKYDEWQKGKERNTHATEER